MKKEVIDLSRKIDQKIWAFGKFEAPPISEITERWIKNIWLPRILMAAGEPNISLRMDKCAKTQMVLRPDVGSRNAWENIKSCVLEQVNLHLTEVITPHRLRLVAKLEPQGQGLTIYYVNDIKNHALTESER